MTGTENVFDGFALLGDDEEFDVDKIFGSGSDEPAPPPPAPTLAEEVKPQFDPEQVQTETPALQPEPEQTLPAKRRKLRQKKKNSLWDSFRRLQARKATPSQKQPRSKALRQDPKHNCRSLTSRPFSVRRRQRADHGRQHDLRGLAYPESG